MEVNSVGRRLSDSTAGPDAAGSPIEPRSKSDLGPNATRDKGSDGGFVQSPDPEVTWPEHWTMRWSGPVPVLVTGGITHVDTDALRCSAAHLTVASELIDHVIETTWAIAQEIDDVSTPFATPLMRALELSLAMGGPAWDPVGPPSGSLEGTTAGLISGREKGGVLVEDPPACQGFMRERERVHDQLRALCFGSSSLSTTRDELRHLATDLLICAQRYEATESSVLSHLTGVDAGLVNRGVGGGTGASMLARVGVAPGIFDVGHAVAAPRLGSGSSPSVPSPGFSLLSPSVMLAIAGGVPLAAGAHLAGNDLLLDAGIDLATLSLDPTIAQWVVAHVSLIVGLGLYASKARTGQEAIVVERSLAAAAAELDPYVTSRLPARVRVGTREVATSSLTPMQRTARYIASLGAASGALVYGQREGIEVSLRTTAAGSASGASGDGAHGSHAVVLPPASADPFALATPITSPTHLSATPQAADPSRAIPTTISQTIERSRDLQEVRHDDATGAVEVLKIDHADGSVTWNVLVPGTTDWGMGGEQTQDLLTNLQAVGREPTDMESAVVTAMRQAGIAPGQPVALYGHSQGAMTVMNIASDPEVRERFSIETVLTAGGPVGGVELPVSTAALHVEDVGDAVPGLDARMNPSGTNRVTVTVDARALGQERYPHDSGSYADCTRGLEELGEPAVDEWSRRYAAITGAHDDETATTTSYVFDVRRVLS